MVSRAIACGFLFFAPCLYGQDNSLERPASDFDSKGVGLTETFLKFSHQQHLRIAVEYVDRASIKQPITVNLQNKTVRQGLDTILRNGHGYSWRLRGGIVEITNRRGSKRADEQLNMVIPVFRIADGEKFEFKHQEVPGLIAAQSYPKLPEGHPVLLNVLGICERLLHLGARAQSMFFHQRHEDVFLALELGIDSAFRSARD